MKKILTGSHISTLIGTTVILALMVSATYSHGKGWMTDYIDSSPDQLVNKVPHSFKGDVIIIGAGAAGLAAANLLELNDVKYSIIEATSRYGGRLEQNTNFAGLPIDLGAEWIHQDKKILNRLIGKNTDAPISRNLIRYNPSDVYWWDGEIYEQDSGLSLKIEQWSYPEYKFKDSTWFDFVEEYFAKNVQHKIIYNSPVTSINYSGDKVAVITEGGQRYSTDKVISTVSIGVLKANSIAFVPELSNEKRAAINSVEFLPGFKLFMKFSEKFYPDMIGVDTDSGEKTYYDVAFKKDATDNVFGLLSTGDSAEYYYRLGSDKAVVKAVLEELDKLFNGKASTSFSGEYLIKDWGKARFTLGTWTDAYNNEDLIDVLLAPLQHKVYFAGETFDPYGQYSTVPGAIISGYSAVYQLLEEHDM